MRDELLQYNLMLNCKMQRSGITGDWEYAGESSSGPAVIVSASLGEWGVGATALPV